jgi:hypothetical protein
MSATTCWGWRALSLGRLVSPQPKSKPLASYKWYTHGGEALRWHRMQNGRVRRASRAASGCHAERREQRWAGPKARQSLPSGSHSQCDLEAVIRDLPSAESKEAEMGSNRRCLRDNCGTLCTTAVHQGVLICKQTSLSEAPTHTRLRVRSLKLRKSKAPCACL